MKYKKNKNISCEKIDDVMIVLNHDTGKYLELNRSAVFIWSIIENKNRDQIVQLFSNNFKVSNNEAAMLTDEFLDNCVQHRLIV